MKGLVILDDGSVMLEPPRRIHITHDFNRGNFVVTVSRFQPGPDDATAYVWSDVSGTEHTFRLPPYYITDMEEAGRNMYKYIWDACGKFPRILLVNSNPIIKRTFIEAERYCKASKVSLLSAHPVSHADLLAECLSRNGTHALVCDAHDREILAYMW